MNSSVVIFPDLSRPKQASAGLTEISDRESPSALKRKPSFANAMKQAESGAPTGAASSELRRRPSQGSEASSSSSARARTETEARPRSARSACSPRAVNTADDNRPSDRAERMASTAVPPPTSKSIAPDAEDIDSDLPPSEPGGKTATTTTEPTDDKSNEDAVQAANIIVLPPPPNILLFPLMQTGTAPIGVETALTVQPPPEAIPLTTTMGEIIPLPRTVAGSPGQTLEGKDEPASAQPGLIVPAAELPPLTDRERMAVSLRLAMARLDEQDPTASALAPKPDSDSRLVPFPAADATPGNNIIEVQFSATATPQTGADAASRKVSSDMTVLEFPLGTETQLPVDPRTPATIAHADVTQADTLPLNEVTSAPVQASKLNDQGKHGERSTSSATAGTSTARRDRNMDSTSTFAAFTGPEGAVGAAEPEMDEARSVAAAPRLESIDRLSATSWPAVGPTEAHVHRSGGISVDPARPVDAAASVERITALISRETTLFRQHGSDSMAVVLRPDANTELLVHLSRNNGQIEANVRCERGDFQQLNALWGQLQEALGHQKVRLAPLEESTGDPSQFRQTGGGFSQQGQNREESGRQSPADRQSMEEWPAPASPLQNPAHVRSGTGDLGRRHSTSRPGWETWA